MKSSLSSHHNIYQTQQIRELERLAQEKYQISPHLMMQRAGKAAFDFLLQRFPGTKKITVCCGHGNNGGDGYVLARHATLYGMEVKVWHIGDPSHLKEEARAAFEACQQAGTVPQAFADDSEFDPTELIIDAICGIGIKSELKGEGLAMVEKMGRSSVPILSIDVPTGIDADTGCILGKAVKADATITFIGLKLGLLTGKGIAHTGDLLCADLQLPAELFTEIRPVAENIHLRQYASYLKPRPRYWHKGLSGHVLIVGGEQGYSGAPRMAAEAALRVGAGLVSIATRPEQAALMNTTRPELMCHGIKSPDEMAFLVRKANVIVIGPGLGQSAWAKSLWEHVCKQALPLVVDADGLNLLAQSQRTNPNWVLTPHPGEAARLLDVSAAEIELDRLAAVQTIEQRYGGICILKGAGTLIASDKALPALCSQGNPGMASAGMGDVLSGVIGGFVAQGIPLSEAAKLSVCVHAMAGDLAAAQTGERGTLAMDLMPFLQRLSNLPLT